MSRKKKPRVDKIFQDNGGGYIIPPVQKPLPEEVEFIEKVNEKEKNYVLVICEKPQAAMKIAYALADIAPIKRNMGGIPYYELEHDSKKFIVVSAVGHLFGLAEKEKTTSWPVFEIEWRPIPGFARKYASVISHFAKNASDFIIACDYDVEGELIGFNVLRFLCNQQDAKRMKFSTLTKYDLLESYKKIMQNIDFGQAYAGETRHYLDWFYGINLSRALMEALKNAGVYRIMSIGRVQGPALALVVKREQEIKNFKPAPYWIVFLSIEGINNIELKYNKEIFSKEEAEKFLKLKNEIAEAETIVEKRKLKPLPPFDLTSLQLEAHKFFGFSPMQTQMISQNLYLQGLISYPRTSSQKLPPTIGLSKILTRIEKIYPDLVKFVTRTKPIEGKKTDPAHPAIFPTGEYPEKLTPQERQIYDLIVRRFLACFCDDVLIEEKRIILKIDKKEFSSQGLKILKKGWLDVYPYKIEEKILPDLNGKVRIKDIRLEQKETQPPKRYSPASLVSELEKRNLGTKATRAAIVDTLYKRGYIVGSSIQATKLGMAVVDAFKNNCPLIIDEKLTRSFEEKMERIQQEKNVKAIIKEKNQVIEEAKKTLLKISEQFKKHEKDIGKFLIEAHYEVQEETKKANILFKCPICSKGSLIILRSKKGKRFAACDEYPECKTTFALPQFGLVQPSEKKCECGWPMLILIRKGKPPWNFCLNPSHYKTKEKKSKLKRKKGKTKK
ncbi:MAG: DNA topoisomerase I [Candidatus Pacearchaeota archaeon]